MPLPKHNVKRYNNKSEIWNTVKPTSLQKPQLQSRFNLLQGLSLCAFFCGVIYTFFNCFSKLFLRFSLFEFL